MKATAAVCTAPNKIVFDQVEVREPEGTEIRVKITAVGICGTDLTAKSATTTSSGGLQIAL